MLKFHHKFIISNMVLVGFALWNMFVWDNGTLSALLIGIMFIRNFGLYSRNRAYLSHLQMYEDSSARILQHEELTYIPPVMTEDDELLGVEFNKLMRALQRQYAVNQSNSQIISSVSRVIEAPLAILNSGGKIDYANDSFKSWHWGRDIRNVRNRELRNVLQDALLREIPLKQELEIEKKFYVATSNPIQDEEKKLVGIVILFHDVTELKNYQHLQREFFGSASHELKTPISAIKGCTEILLGGNHAQETYTEFLTIIQDENLRLERLVQDLLLINRYEHQQISIHHDELLLNRVVTDCILQVLNVANLKDQKIHFEATEPVFFKGDRTMLQHSFLNLLTNAIHYSGEGSVIEVKLSRADGQIKLSFQDNGVGIPEADLPHIFERFYRVDKARSRHSGGSGLGLSIVLTIIEAHKGTIHVKSVLDEGTTFEIYLEENL